MDRRWDKSKPPRGPFTLNRDCPQARGLVAWYPMGGASGRTAVLDLVGKAHLSGTTRGGTLGEDGRPALTYSSGSSDSLASSVIVLAAYPCTIAGWYRQTSAASAAIACMSSTDGAAGHGRKLLYAGSNFTVRAFDENSGGGAQAVTTAAGSLNRWAHGAAVFASSTSRTAYSNGASPVQDTTDTGTWANGQDTRLGSDLAGNLCTGDIGEIGFWNVALDDGLIYRLYDPAKRFELWYPLRSRKWFVQGAGGGANTTLVVTQGAYALTGQSVGLKSSRQLSVSQGAYSLTGQSVALRAARQLVVAQGAYSLSGQSVGLNASRRLSIPQGSYTLSGQSVDLNAATAATLYVTQGGYTLNGQAVNLRAARQLSITQGAYALTGQSVTLSPTKALAITQGAYALTGQDVQLRAALKLAVSTGYYALSGQAVALTYGSIAPPPVPAPAPIPSAGGGTTRRRFIEAQTQRNNELIMAIVMSAVTSGMLEEEALWDR